MRKEDKIAIDIYNDLIMYFDELSNEVGEYSNVVGVFCHKIMIYLTNYLLLSNSADNCLEPVEFPFLNKKYVNSPWPIYFERKKESVSYKKFFFAQLYVLLSWVSFKKTIYFELSVGRINELLPVLFKEKYRVKIKSQSKCYLPKKNHQMLFLGKSLKAIVNKYFLTLSSKKESDVFVNNFLRYVEQYVTSDNSVLNGKEISLIIGSPSILSSRINAANILQAGGTVTAVSHSKSSIVNFVEPYVAYGELSYCSNYIDCGNRLQLKNYLGPFRLLHQVPNMYYYSEKLIKSIYSNKNNFITTHKLNNMSKIVYVPNVQLETKRYGPFRDLDAVKYNLWQKKIIHVFGKNNNKLAVKLHPSSSLNPLGFGELSVCTGKLENILNDYDIFILDYFSTAHAVIAATNKTIIYFNIGLRNISHESLVLFKNRVYWFDIDLDGDINEQIQIAIHNYSNFSGCFINEYTKKYSLSNSDQKESFHDALIDALK